MSIAYAFGSFAVDTSSVEASVLTPIIPSASVPNPAPKPSEIRRKRGLIIAALCPIKPEGKENRYRVPSQKGSGSYLVSIDPKKGPEWRCECKDYETTGEACKHIYAVQHVLEQQRSADADPDKTTRKPYLYEHQKKAMAVQAIPKRPTYKQDWPAYNAAQGLEKRKPSCILRSPYQEPEEIRRCGLPPR